MPTSDLRQWGVVGPVRTLRSESASWDREKNDWERPFGISEVEFRPDGRVARTTYHNPDGSLPTIVYSYDGDGRLVEIRWAGQPDRTVLTYDAAGRLLQTSLVSDRGSSTVVESFTYDAIGRKTKVDFLAVSGQRSRDGATALSESDLFVNVPGAVTATTIYDKDNRPVETRYHDASHLLVHTASVTRDPEGRVALVESRFTGTVQLPGDFEQHLASMSEEDREKLTTLMNAAFGDSAFTAVSYEYDRKGRPAVKTMRMGTLDETRTTYVYDARDNAVEQVDEDRSHDLRLEDSGEIASTETTRTQRTRFDYLYDDRGNWTERISSVQSSEATEFVSSAIERRRLTYWAA